MWSSPHSSTSSRCSLIFGALSQETQVNCTIFTIVATTWTLVLLACLKILLFLLLPLQNSSRKNQPFEFSSKWFNFQVSNLPLQLHQLAHISPISQTYPLYFLPNWLCKSKIKKIGGQLIHQLHHKIHKWDQHSTPYLLGLPLVISFSCTANHRVKANFRTYPFPHTILCQFIALPGGNIFLIADLTENIPVDELSHLTWSSLCTFCNKEKGVVWGLLLVEIPIPVFHYVPPNPWATRNWIDFP